MFCPNCGKEVQSDYKFCTACGKPISVPVTIEPIKVEKKAPLQLTLEDYEEYHQRYLKNTLPANQCILWDYTKETVDDLPSFCFVKDNPIYAVFAEKGTFSSWYIGVTQKGFYLMRKSFNIFMPYADFVKTHKLYDLSDVYIGTYKFSSTFGWKKMECLHQHLKMIDMHFKLQ